MGFKYSYNMTNAAREINAAARDASSSSNDGFIAWGAKQDLYRLKWLIDQALSRCPTFSIESEWLKEQEQQRIVGILRNDI